MRHSIDKYLKILYLSIQNTIISNSMVKIISASAKNDRILVEYLLI